MENASRAVGAVKKRTLSAETDPLPRDTDPFAMVGPVLVSSPAAVNEGNTVL